MKSEKAELEERITKLLAFIEGDKFKDLEPVDQRLLMMQYCGMETYLTSLVGRLLREDMKRYGADIKALKEQADAWREEGKTDEEIAAMFAEKLKAIPEIGRDQFDGIASAMAGGFLGA